MSRRSGSSFKTRAALVAICALSAAALARQVARPLVERDRAASVEKATARALPALPAHDFGLAPTSAYAAMVDRPLFNETRRPVDAAAVAAEPEPPRRPPSWTLIGTVITPAKASALLVDARTKQIFELERGMTREGWQVADVARDNVRLESASGAHELTMVPE